MWCWPTPLDAPHRRRFARCSRRARGQARTCMLRRRSGARTSRPRWMPGARGSIRRWAASAAVRLRRTNWSAMCRRKVYARSIPRWWRRRSVCMPNTADLEVVTLNRPAKRNALNPEIIAMLTDAFTKADRPVLLRAEGKAFCAGLDLDALGAMMQQSYEANLEDARRLGAMYYRIWNYPKPVIAAVQGPALAGG